MAHSVGDCTDIPIYGSHYLVTFPIADADGDPVSGATGLDSEVSIDLGGFTDCTNEATEIGSSGIYYLYLTGAEMTGKLITVQIKTTSSGAKTTILSIPTTRMAIIATGTAQAGAAGTITLAASTSKVDNDLAGYYVRCNNNSPSGVQYATRRIISNVASTQVATVESNWGTNPSSATTYDLLAPLSVNVNSFGGTMPPTLARAGVQDVNTVRITDQTQTARDIGASVLLSNGTGTGQLKLASGYVAMTWADIAAPTTTVNLSGTTIGTLTTYTGNTPQTGDSYAIVNHATYGNAKLVRATTPDNTLTVDASGRAYCDVKLWDTKGVFTDDNDLPIVAIKDYWDGAAWQVGFSFGSSGISEATLAKYVGLMVRNDNAIFTDLTAELALINTDYASGGGTHNAASTLRTIYLDSSAANSYASQAVTSVNHATWGNEAIWKTQVLQSRSDAGSTTDLAAYLTNLNQDFTSGGGSFTPGSDSLEGQAGGGGASASNAETGTVLADGGNSATSFLTNMNAMNGFASHVGGRIWFNSGANENEMKYIISHDLGTGAMQVNAAFANTPADNDTFIAEGYNFINVDRWGIGAQVFSDSNDVPVISVRYIYDGANYVSAETLLGGGGGSEPALLASTTIATLTSQTVFTLTAGPPDNPGIPAGSLVVVTANGNPAQKAVGTVASYNGGSLEITLASDPGAFTMAVGDAVAVIAQGASVADILNEDLTAYSTPDTVGYVLFDAWNYAQSAYRALDAQRYPGEVVADGGNTATSFLTDMTTANDAPDLKYQQIRFNGSATASLYAVARAVVAHDLTTGLITLDYPLPATPADTDEFVAGFAYQSPSAGGGGGGDATAANQTIIIDHLTDIKGTGWNSGTDTLALLHDDNTANNTLLLDVPTNAELGTAISGLATQTSVDDLPTNVELAAALLGLATTADTQAAKLAADGLDAPLGTSTAAAKLGTSADMMLKGTVDHTAFTATTTQFESDDITTAVTDHYKNRIVIFTSGALLRQVCSISAYSLVSGRGRFTVSALTSAPADNVTFIIV